MEVPKNVGSGYLKRGCFRLFCYLNDNTEWNKVKGETSVSKACSTCHRMLKKIWDGLSSPKQEIFDFVISVTK